MREWLRWNVWPWREIARLESDAAWYKERTSYWYGQAVRERAAADALATPLPTTAPPEERELEGALFSGEWVKFYIGEEGFKFPLEEMQWLLTHRSEETP